MKKIGATQSRWICVSIEQNKYVSCRQQRLHGKPSAGITVSLTNETVIDNTLDKNELKQRTDWYSPSPTVKSLR